MTPAMNALAGSILWALIPFAAISVGRAASATAATTTLNPSDKSATINLDDTNLKATADSSSTYGSVRGTTSKSSGKWYIEFTIDVDAGYVLYVGLATSSQSLSSSIGQSANSVGLAPDSCVIYYNAASTTTVYTGVTGDKIGLAVDVSAGLIWFLLNGTPIAGNPAAGTGGKSIGTGKTWFPAIGARNNMAALANFGNGLTYSPPAGFSAWG